MKNVSRIIPCYSADTSGVCSALYELGGLIVTHDASGCNSTYATHDEPRWYDMQSKMYISALTEIDAVMGNDEKLICDVVSAAKDQNPEFIAVFGSPMPMMTGVDFDAVAAEIEKRSGIRTFGLHTNGTHSYIDGASEAFLAITKEYVRECPKTQHRSVNILGATPLDLPLGADVSLKQFFKEDCIDVVSCMAMGSSLDEIKQAASADLNIVVSYSGMATAKYMYEKFGIPYYCGFPMDKRDSNYLGFMFCGMIIGELLIPNGSVLRNECKLYNTVIIGESIFASSLASAIGNIGYGARIICPLPTEDSLLRDCDFQLSAEEDIEAALKEIKPKFVIADPLYEYIVPKESKFISLPHFAFSGRCFSKKMPNLINGNIEDFLEPYKYYYTR